MGYRIVNGAGEVICSMKAKGSIRQLGPNPERVADYFVPASQMVARQMSHSFELLLGTLDNWYCKQTHTIGQQPSGSVMIPGTEREDSE